MAEKDAAEQINRIERIYQDYLARLNVLKTEREKIITELNQALEVAKLEEARRSGGISE